MRADSPAPAHLDDALELADILRPAWSGMQHALRESGVPLNDEIEDNDTGGEDQPSGDVEPPAGGDQPGADDEASFTDAYNPDDVPEEARPVLEAAYKRLQADYTTKRMSDAEAVRNAQEAQAIVDGLLDPARQRTIAEALGIPLAQQELEDEDFDFDDPNERIDHLQQQLAQRDERDATAQEIQRENELVTEQIEDLEGDLHLEEIGLPFDEHEVGLLYLYADEHRDAQGNPDVKSAHKVLDAIASSHVKRMAAIRARAPRRMGNGSAAERQVDLSTEENRVDAGVRAAQRLLAERQSLN